MARHGRPSQGDVSRFAARMVLAILLVCLSSPRLPAEPAGVPKTFLRDAELRDVFFRDPDRGWAVGDRGAIWHTEDGGRHWHLQESPVTCRLESVSFVDDQRGWIVGGWTRPYTHHSVGVVLRTDDGGQHWGAIRRGSLPALKRVKFLDGRRGWAVGQTNALYPAGVFRTDDGGLSWSSVPGTHPEGWLSADWLSPELGTVAGRHGATARLLTNGLQPQERSADGLRSARCVRLSGQEEGDRTLALRGIASGWLVGDGGLVLQSRDGGGTWQTPLRQLPASCQQMDFQSVTTTGGQTWIVGDPGTLVLHTPDGGNTWSVFETNHSLPLRAVHFLDEHRGWAVGSLGTILVTRNGGRSWTCQQRGGRRAALLGIFAEAERVPMEVIAKFCGDESYLAAIDVIGAVPENPVVDSVAPCEDRMREAVIAMGASSATTAWQFPVRHPSVRASSQMILKDWNVLHGHRAAEVLERQLVAKIRMWRPEVIITESASPRGDDPLGQLICQAVLAAVERASEPDAYPDQIDNGLEPWKVKKVFSSLGGDVAGTVNITTTRLASRLGCSLADEARTGWQLVRRRSRPAPQTYGLRLLVSQLPDGIANREVFSGTSSAVGSENRRAPHATPPGDLRMISRLALQRRNVEQLLGHLTDGDPQGSAWVSQVGNLINGLDPASGGEILFELAQELHDHGRSDLTVDVLDLLVRRYPQHDLVDAALIWLMQYHASGEAAWAFRRETVAVATGRTVAPEAAASPPTNGVAAASFQPASPLQASSPVAAAVYHQPAVREPASERAAQAARYAELIQHMRPGLFWEPQVRFPLASTDRLAGRQREAESYFHQLAGTRSMDCWWACAKSELWLGQSQRQPPKPRVRCQPTDQRPRLDGRLDDETWKTCLPVSLASLHSDDAEWPTAVMLAYDDQFLYVAASCGKSPRADYAPAAESRVRDADLDQHDRIEILIDVDRDYTTYFRLTIDHRGWARDTCLGSAAWDPKWYIASSDTDRTWNVEMAIPWTELGASAPISHDTWAMGLQRIVPGTGFQSWTSPASPEIEPAGFGLLAF